MFWKGTCEPNGDGCWHTLWGLGGNPHPCRMLLAPWLQDTSYLSGGWGQLLQPGMPSCGVRDVEVASGCHWARGASGVCSRKSYSAQGVVLGQSHSTTDISTFLWMEWDSPKAGVQFQLRVWDTLGELLVHGRASLLLEMPTQDFNFF